jgi:hypothetical protein
MTADEKRRLLILYYINSKKEHWACDIDPDKYWNDLKFLEKEGLVKNKKITIKGQKEIQTRSVERIRRIRRFFFSD